MPIPSKEPLLELPEEDSAEHLESQVQRAQEQLLALKRQQESIERQKRELEELSKRQELLQTGRVELIEQFTRALVVIEREEYDTHKRAEQLRTIHASFVSHLATLEAINPKSWDPADLGKELSRALSAVDDARAEFTRSRAVVNAESDEEVLAVQPGDAYHAAFGAPEQDFFYWLKSGFAFTLPLLILGLILLVAVVVVFGNP